MQVNNQNRTGIIAASTIAGVGAGVAAGYYKPFVNAKGEANSDRFVKEVAKEMNGGKLFNLVNAASAKDYLVLTSLMLQVQKIILIQFIRKQRVFPLAMNKLTNSSIATVIS